LQKNPICFKLNLVDDCRFLGTQIFFPHMNIVTWTHICFQLLDMDPITSRVLSQIEVNCNSNCVWETITCIGASLEAKDDDFNNDLFYIPSSSPSKCISAKLKAQMGINHGRRRSCILLDYHLKIHDQVLYPPFRLHYPPQITLKSMEKDQNR
jgi:hypothetical protein